MSHKTEPVLSFIHKNTCIGKLCCRTADSHEFSLQVWVKTALSTKCEYFIATDFHVNHSTLLRSSKHLKTKQWLNELVETFKDWRVIKIKHHENTDKSMVCFVNILVNTLQVSQWGCNRVCLQFLRPFDRFPNRYVKKKKAEKLFTCEDKYQTEDKKHR